MPGAHSWHTLSDSAPTVVEYFPAAQRPVQATALGLLWYFPRGHGVQAEDPSLPPYLPGEQSVQSFPPLENLPIGQFEHCNVVEDESPLKYFPSGQPSQAVMPTVTANFPVAQERHEVSDDAPATELNLPLSQDLHVLLAACPCPTPYLPGGQFTQSLT